MPKNQAIIPADMQRQAKKIAIQASKLADEARPMTAGAAKAARERADIAAEWAKPRIGEARVWLAAKAADGSVSVEKKLAPRVAEMLALAAMKLDPPKRSRRLPMLVAGITLLAAGAAAATAMAMRNRSGTTDAMPPPMPAKPSSTSTAESSAVLNPSAEGEHTGTDAEVDGLSRTKR